MKDKFCPLIGFGQKLVLKIPILQLKLPIRKLRNLFAKKKRHLFDKKNGQSFTPTQVLSVRKPYLTTF